MDFSGLVFSGLIERSRKKGWAFVALDFGLDTTTPSGEMMAKLRRTDRERVGQSIDVEHTEIALAALHHSRRSCAVRFVRRAPPATL